MHVLIYFAQAVRQLHQHSNTLVGPHQHLTNYATLTLTPHTRCICAAALPQAVRRLWGRIDSSIEAIVARSPHRSRAAVESEVKRRYLVLDTKQRSLSLSQEGMALLFNLMLQEPSIQFR